jgi:hypothetical protein
MLGYLTRLTDRMKKRGFKAHAVDRKMPSWSIRITIGLHRSTCIILLNHESRCSIATSPLWYIFHIAHFPPIPEYG